MNSKTLPSPATSELCNTFLPPPVPSPNTTTLLFPPFPRPVQFLGSSAPQQQRGNVERASSRPPAQQPDEEQPVAEPSSPEFLPALCLRGHRLFPVRQRYWLWFSPFLLLPNWRANNAWGGLWKCVPGAGEVCPPSKVEAGLGKAPRPQHRHVSSRRIPKEATVGLVL